MANTGNIQQIIDYGVTANDGTGDPLRTAFIKTDENFDNIWLAGPVGSNITIGNNTIQVNDTNGNLILKPNGIGIVETKGSILPDFDQLRDLGSPERRFRSIYFNGTLDTASNLSVQNLTVANSLDLNGDVVIDGNLTVSGTTLTVNVANLDISDKMIVIANGSPNSQVANGAGITIDGANAQLFYDRSIDSWNSNKNFVVEKEFAIGNFLDDNWKFLPEFGFLSFPTGASWQSDLSTNDEYIRSGIDGYITISTYSSDSGIQTEIQLEHGFVRIKTYNGVNYEWDFNEDGSFIAPGNIRANANGNIWGWSGDTMSFPSGALWRSDAATKDEYISGATDGYINISTYDSTSAVASEIKMEHGLVSIKIHNGPDVEWDFDQDGSFSTPGTIFANAINISNDLYVKTGTFTGDERGDNSIYAGSPSFTFLGTDVVAQFSGNVNQYTQFNFQNYNSGPQASGDYVITADNGTDATHFLNIGLAGSGWDGSQPNSLGTEIGPNDGYMYVQDGNLAIGTKIGSNKHIWIFNDTGDLSGQGTFSANTTITPPVALANLIPTAGARAFINDSNLVANSSTFGAQVSGGAANTVPVWSDGTNWYIG